MFYVVLCKKCGRILMKTPEAVVGVLKIEIKCPQCHELLKMPQDVLIKPIGEKKSEKSLHSGGLPL